MDSPDAPPPPDTVGAAQEQGVQNRLTAASQYQLGATNQYTPFGSQEYRQVGYWPDGTPRYEQQQTLNPADQQILDLQRGATSNLTSRIGQPMDMSGAPGLRTGYNSDFSADRARVEEAMLGRLNEQLGRDRGSLEQDLANKGITQGSEAYTNAMTDFSRGEQEARTAALLGAGQEQSRMAQLAQQEAAFANQSRGQYMDEQYAARNQPLNELSALRGGGQLSSPSFSAPPQPGVAPTDIIGAQNAANQHALSQYGADVGQHQSNMSGLYGLGSAALMAFMLSDERVKDDHGVVGKTKDGIPIHSFRYKGSPFMQMGVMAQEVEKVKPEAVAKRPDGLRMVDYSKVA